MKVVLGLGNHGPEYVKTRHNVGFLLVNALAKKNRILINMKGHFSCYGIGKIAGVDVLLARPQTYMNLSGKTAVSILSKYCLTSANLIVVHDDIDLVLGRIKIKAGGGDAGHRGIRSISTMMGKPDYCRVRIGVGRPPEDMEVSDYVLSPFGHEDIEEIKAAIIKGVEELENIIGNQEY